MLFHANNGCSTASNADKPNICLAATYMKVVLRIVENDDCDELRHVGTGVYNAESNIDRVKDVGQRSYSANTYYDMSADRSNLQVFLSTMVCRS